MPETVKIRSATRDDLPAIHPIIERAYRGETARAGWTHEADLIIESPRTDIDTLTAIVDDPEQCLLVADAGNGLLGCVQVTYKGDGLAYLGLLCVDPGLQSGGLGKQLVTAAEDCAREDFGATTMEMTVIDKRVELIAFYERRGYRICGEKRDFPVPLDPPLFMDVLVKNLGA